MLETYHLTCERCGAAYTSNKPDDRFCSKLCKDLVGNDAKSGNTTPTYMDNGCTIRVSLFAEAVSLINLKTKPTK